MTAGGLPRTCARTPLAHGVAVGSLAATAAGSLRMSTGAELPTAGFAAPLVDAFEDEGADEAGFAAPQCCNMVKALRQSLEPKLALNNNLALDI